MLHFWLPDGPSQAEVVAWAPDREPSRFASGLGHNLLELFARLHADGVPVTLGSEVVRGTRLIVLYAAAIEALAERKAALRVIRRNAARYVLIRGDAPVPFRMPVPPVVDFVPIPRSARKPNQCWLPPLPQRGLVRRRTERFGRLRTLAFKGNPENVPLELRAAEFASELTLRGIELVLDTPRCTDGADQRWHDFADVDAVLCLRRPDKWRDIERKPPTRVINAWCAGCIPIAGREPGYLDVATDQEDALFVDNPRGCLDAIDRLHDDTTLIREIERRIQARAADFSPRLVYERWRDTLVTAASDEKYLRDWLRTGAAVAAGVRGAFRR